MHRILAAIGELTFESCEFCKHGKGALVVDLELSAVLCKRFKPRAVPLDPHRKKKHPWNAFAPSDGTEGYE
jgi:hypothetical protein